MATRCRRRWVWKRSGNPKCVAPNGYVANAQDCNDLDTSINPVATEICDAIDNDCDQLIDDTDPSVIGQITWNADFDRDGFGDPSQSTTSCEQPTNFVNNSEDCDDDNEDINPLANEICDGVDEDCDGQIDPASVCPCNYHTESGNAYSVREDALQWPTALFSCEITGYNLAIINSEAEKTWVDSIADSYSTNKWWIGANDRSRRLGLV